jgi:hypothetical protein
MLCSLNSPNYDLQAIETTKVSLMRTAPYHTTTTTGLNMCDEAPSLYLVLYIYLYSLYLVLYIYIYISLSLSLLSGVWAMSCWKSAAPMVVRVILKRKIKKKTKTKITEKENAVTMSLFLRKYLLLPELVCNRDTSKFSPGYNRAQKLLYINYVLHKQS